jgi:hypothetical protein
LTFIIRDAGLLAYRLLDDVFGLSLRAVVLLPYRDEPSSSRSAGRALGLHCCKILDQHEVKPHKVRYYPERRDVDFETKMAEVLCVYGEVDLFKEDAEGGEGDGSVSIVSYDEKLGIQAIGTRSRPHEHVAFGRGRVRPKTER